MTIKVRQNKHLSAEELYQRSLKLSRSSNGIIPHIGDEVDRFEEEVKAFRAGEVDVAEFMPLRLHHGVYGQRQPDRQMMRVKIPGGILTPEALEALGQLAEKYTPLKKGHVTTRENMQFSHLLLEDCADIMRFLGEAGLTTRDACANTVRNVVGSPTAGLCADEVFDVTPYLAAYVRFAVRNPLTQNFPRKFKTSFSGCVAHDAVNSALHDLSFIGQVRAENGVEKRGFKVMVGGATSIMPRLGKVLYDFVPEEDYLRVTEAVWRVFDQANSLRKNKMMARIKVLIDRIGFDAFKELVETELREVGPIDPRPLMELDETLQEKPPPLVKGHVNGTRRSADFQYWKKSNTAPQKQEGYYIVYVKLPRGDISADQFSPLAEIVRKYTGGSARTTLEQNLALRWVPEGNLYAVWKRLKEMGLAEPDLHTITDVVACPGTDSCKLGITSSMGLAAAIRQELGTWDGLLEDPLIRELHIKISGCPNGCSLHHVANIGLHGAAARGASGEQIPAYELFLGGKYGGDSIEETRFGERVPRLKVPAKRVPQLVRKITIHYQENRHEGEPFNDFIDRVGIQPFEAIIQDLTQVETLSPQTQDLYTDWEKSDLYKVERGEGECAI